MDQRIKTVVDLISQDLGRSYSPIRMAQEVNLSVSQFYLLFRADFGMSPMRYIHQARMAAARRLLETTFLSVKQIKYAVGINDTSHFFRDFKQLYGLTPTGHRKARPLRIQQIDAQFLDMRILATKQ